MTTTDCPHVIPTTGGHELREVNPRTLLVDLNLRRSATATATATATADLVASVAEHGVLVPIVGVRTEDGQVRRDVVGAD